MAWGDLTEEQIDEVSLRNLRRIMWAIHAYADANDGKIVPAAIANKKLPPDKRLSGLVALLPYLGVRPSYLDEEDPTWLKWKADSDAAKRLYRSIDLTKSWDDPANEKAARTLVSSFLTPDDVRQDSRGYAVSHFAFVRGGVSRTGAGQDSGSFPLTDQQLTFADIADGTIYTLGVGQVSQQLGPWIAAGTSTSRYNFHPTAAADQPRFGGRHEGGAYFATMDGYCFFLDLAEIDPQRLQFASGRFDNKEAALNDFRFKSATEWKAAKQESKP